MFLVLVVVVRSGKAFAAIFAFVQFEPQMSSFVIFVISLRGKSLLAKSTLKILNALMDLDVVNQTAPELELLATSFHRALILVKIAHEIQIFLFVVLSLHALLVWLILNI